MHSYYELVIGHQKRFCAILIFAMYTPSYMCAVKISQNRFCAILIFATRAVDK
jgi:hypothetical protein